MTTRARALPVLLLAAASLALTACGGDDDGDATTTAPADATGATDAADTTTPSTDGGTGVVVEGFAFTIPATVPAGAVPIQNNDAASHTLTDDAGSFDIALEPNASTVAEIPAGTYSVHCEIHPSMTGTLTVA